MVTCKYCGKKKVFNESFGGEICKNPKCHFGIDHKPEHKAKLFSVESFDAKSGTVGLYVDVNNIMDWAPYLNGPVRVEIKLIGGQ